MGCDLIRMTQFDLSTYYLTCIGGEGGEADTYRPRIRRNFLIPYKVLL